MTRYTLLALFLASPSFAMDLIAHRGNGCGFTENSIEAIRSSRSLGADGVEIDVRSSSDGVLFLYHDDEWRGARVADLAYPEIVTRLGSSAPSLKDVLAEGEPPGYYIIDLKQPDPPFVAALVGLVRETGFGPDRFVFQSDDLEALRTISGEIPSATTLFLVRLPRRDILGRRPSSASVIEGLRGHSVSGLSLKGRSYLDRAYVAALKERGFTVNVWTINRPSRAEHYRELGIDGLITDETRTLRSGLSGEPVSQNACGANGG